MTLGHLKKFDLTLTVKEKENDCTLRKQCLNPIQCAYLNKEG